GGNEVSHRLPHFLPDGSGLLFTVLRFTPSEIIGPQIWVAPKAGRPRLLLENGADARVANNRLVFARDGKLLAVPFDVKALSVTGSPAPLVDDGVIHATRMEAIEAGVHTGAAQYSISKNGSLVYAPGSVEPLPNKSVVWIDEKGAPEPLPIQPRDYSYARVSRDGRHILLTSREGVWLYDTSRQTLESPPSGFGLTVGAPAWSPDGAGFGFASLREGTFAIFLKELTSSSITRLVSGYASPLWSPNGRELAMLASTSEKYSVHILSPQKPDDIRSVLESSTVNYSFPTFSPDGRWLAYCSDESGINQVYVKPYP